MTAVTFASIAAIASEADIHHDRPRSRLAIARSDKQAAEHLASLRDPGHRLDAERVERPRERDAAPIQGAATVAVPAPRRSQRAAPNPRQHRGRERVQDRVREVIPGGLHPPDRVIERERHPRERVIVPHVERREHPAQVRRGRSP